jgi:hypothetical protein
MRYLEIINALIFAQKSLGIKEKNFVFNWTILPFSKKRDFWAIYYLGDMTYYNGEPALGHVFHEAVHVWQFENGLLDKPLAYKKYGGVVKKWAYYKCPIERQANDLSSFLCVKYRKLLIK